jgi:hypothetical protein
MMKWSYTTIQHNYCSCSIMSLARYLGRLLCHLLWLQEAQKIIMYDGCVKLEVFYLYDICVCEEC